MSLALPPMPPPSLLLLEGNTLGYTCQLPWCPTQPELFGQSRPTVSTAPRPKCQSSPGCSRLPRHLGREKSPLPLPGQMLIDTTPWSFCPLKPMSYNQNTHSLGRETDVAHCTT